MEDRVLSPEEWAISQAIGECFESIVPSVIITPKNNENELAFMCDNRAHRFRPYSQEEVVDQSGMACYCGECRFYREEKRE